MGQKKLKRFQAMKTMDNVLEYPENVKGRWSEIFGNSNPIILELAAGKAEYTTERAIVEPRYNFVAVEVKGNRLYIGAKKSLERGTPNARYLRINIDKIEEYFDKDEVAEIWILFPDPFLKDKRAKNRLTHPKFLSKYQSILPQHKLVHLKTDSRELYDFTREVAQEHNCEIDQDTTDIYKQGEPPYPLSIQTFYESMHLADNRTISHISFRLPQEKIHYVRKKKSIES